MTLSEVQLAKMFRTLAKSVLEESAKRTRTPRIVSGTVDDINSEELDVAWIRMDLAAMGADPTQSMNYGEPGVIPTTRLGSTYTGEQVRVEFNGTAGASAMQTSAEKRIILPFGAEDGQRIRLDGEIGYLGFYDESGNLVVLFNSELLAIGDIETPGQRITIDPVGGIRLRSPDDTLVGLLDQQGYTIRSAETGQVTAELKSGSFRMVDPMGTDDIEFVTSSGGTLPNPVYRSAVETLPGTSLVVPAAPRFTSTPADDISIGHVAAWVSNFSTAATATPPAGWTEQHDGNFQDAKGTLQQSVATLDPADGLTGAFTSTYGAWEQAIGTHVVIKGGGTVSPSFRSVSTSQQIIDAAVTDAPVDKPAGTAAGDVVVVFVELGVIGGHVPTGWTTPEGFVFLGANFVSSGAGAAQSTLAVGAWAKLAGASEPASYSTTINLPTGTKMIHATAVAIQGPFLVPGGVQIRMAGKPIRRLLAFNELQAASATLCDFTNIPQGYDNLELVFDATAAGGGTQARLAVRFNGDTTAGHYFNKVVQDGVDAGVADNAQIRGPGALSITAGSKSAGSVNIYGYNSSPKPVVLYHCWWGAAAVVHDETGSGQWDGNAGVSAIDRVQLVSPGLGSAQFAVGSRAYLYGY